MAADVFSALLSMILRHSARHAAIVGHSLGVRNLCARSSGIPDIVDTNYVDAAIGPTLLDVVYLPPHLLSDVRSLTTMG